MAHVEAQEIPVNRDLLNPKFEQYKLSLDDIPVKEYPLDRRVAEIPLFENSFSLQQLKAISQLNALILDAWNLDHVYYINEDLKVIGHFVNQVPSEHNEFVVADLSPKNSTSSGGFSFPITLLFADEDHAFISGGAGQLFLAKTGNRGCIPSHLWRIQQIKCEGTHDFIVQYATSWLRASNLVFEVVVLYVEEIDTLASGDNTSNNGNRTTGFSTNLEWLTISENVDKQWTIERIRRLVGKSPPDYVAIEPRGQAVSIAGPHLFQFTFDSISPVTTASAPEEEMDISSFQVTEPEYTWMQSPEDLTVHFMVPPDTKKPDLNFTVTGKSIKFVHAGSGKVLLEGELHSCVDVYSSTWTLSGNKIELTLAKKDAEQWQTVVVGDTRGKQVFSNHEMEEFNRRLAALTSDKWVTAKDVGSFNVQELEECDATLETDILNSWVRFDGETHLITHKMDLSGNHFLFKMLRCGPNILPTACLRYDVDALLIEPVVPLATSNQGWNHIATFDALGYVLASKEQKKFTTCSPCKSFAAVCDGNRNVFIYRSNFPVDSDLKNRKTGEIIKTVGKQHVYSLEKPGNILGFAANNHTVFILKADSLVTLLV